MDHKKIEISCYSNLSLELVNEIAHNKSIEVGLSEDSKLAVKKSRDVVEDLISSDKVIYGLNTGFGSLKDQSIDNSQLEQLQENLIRSHAAGSGEAFSEPEVRAAVLIRANSLAKGYSGVRLELVEKLLELLNKGMYPFVPEQGSCGASGDLAPLSHLALVLMGEGELIVDGHRKSTQSVLSRYNFIPIKLQAKEGLALNNGTSFLTAIAALNVYKAKKLSRYADKALGLSLEGLMGTLTAFDERIHSIRPHAGQLETARVIRNLCEASELVGPGNDYINIQDSYSLRCSAQVHGPIKQMIKYVEEVVEVEINSVTDNPLIFTDTEEILSGGNFHGEPIGLAMDSLAIAMTELANISERRTAKFMDPNHNNKLPAYLIGSEQQGLNSGFMIMQYTAAAILAEMKVLSHPVVVDSVPTSANQEDYVSFATTASRKCRDIVDMLERILAIELISAAQAVDLRKPRKLGKGNKKTYDFIREDIPFIVDDEVMYVHLENLQNRMKG